VGLKLTLWLQGALSPRGLESRSRLHRGVWRVSVVYTPKGEDLNNRYVGDFIGKGKRGYNVDPRYPDVNL
jgi:hypothetical protein